MAGACTAATRLRSTLAFRLTAAYSLGGLLLLLLGTASLYIVLRIELERSTELFLADKLHVLRSMCQATNGLAVHATLRGMHPAGKRRCNHLGSGEAVEITNLLCFMGKSS